MPGHAWNGEEGLFFFSPPSCHGVSWGDGEEWEHFFVPTSANIWWEASMGYHPQWDLLRTPTWHNARQKDWDRVGHVSTDVLFDANEWQGEWVRSHEKYLRLSERRGRSIWSHIIKCHFKSAVQNILTFRITFFSSPSFHRKGQRRWSYRS